MSSLALVVDDHPASLELARYLLAHAGFDVECARDGIEALSLTTALHPDVVILDLAIPLMDGCELRDRLAADPALAAIPVVVMSVHEISTFCPGHTLADFAHYVRKPVDPETFVAIVQAAVKTGP